MNKNIKILFIGFIILVPGLTFASQQPNENPENQEISFHNISEDTKNDKTLRPKKPSRQQVTGFYSSGELQVSFAIPEGECVMTLESPESGLWTYTFDSEDVFSTYIGIVENASISISTELGHTYTGAIK